MDCPAGIQAVDLCARYSKNGSFAAPTLHCKGQDEETDWVLEQWEFVLTDLRHGYI